MSTTNQQKFQNPNLVQQKLISGFQKQLIKIAKSARPTSILEVGCGEGYLLQKITQAFPGLKIVGIDKNQDALSEGKKIFPHLNIKTGDIYRLDESDNSWDLVVASEVLEHLDHPVNALRELNRVSRKYVLLSVPYEPWFRLGNLARGRHLSRFGNHPEHVNLWSRSGFSRFVAKEMKIEILSGSFPWTIVLARV